MDTTQMLSLRADIARWGEELGFDALAVSTADPGVHGERFQRWLDAGLHGEMDYLARNVDKRLHPERLHPQTARVISVRMNYLPQAADSAAITADRDRAFIARYALGRDYHKVVRKRLAQLAERIRAASALCEIRAFTDSAPVLEKAFAVQAGLGWIGKHTLLLHQEAGSYFFLGELLTNLPLPIDGSSTIASTSDRVNQEHNQGHCGSCQACMDVCPTGAIIDEHWLDARKCIAYLTIEYDGVIPLALRAPIGNRIFGCDDCQFVCPHNRKAPTTREADFAVRHGLDDISLLELFSWDEATFLQRTEGSAIRRISYSQWRRNLSVALGNATPDATTLQILMNALASADALVLPHLHWAIERHQAAL